MMPLLRNLIALEYSSGVPITEVPVLMKQDQVALTGAGIFISLAQQLQQPVLPRRGDISKVMAGDGKMLFS
jgi:hypothetical protein